MNQSVKHSHASTAPQRPQNHQRRTLQKPGAPRKVERKRYIDLIIKEKLKSWRSTTQATFDGELTDFLNRMRGEWTGALADGHDGLRSLQVADAVRRSSESREAVHLDPLGSMRG